MIKNKIFNHCFLVAFLFMVVSGFRNKTPGIITGNANFSDTISFAPNTEGGWSTLSIYLNQNTRDSVQFELIIQQTNSIDWSTEQFIGTITSRAFIPQQVQRGMDFYLMRNNIWKVRILTDGKCYFQLTTGSAPEGTTVVLPFKVRYRNT